MNYLTTLTKVVELHSVIYNLAPNQNKRIKSIWQDWFQIKINEKINDRGKLFKKLKKLWPHVEKDVYKKSKTEVQKKNSHKEKSLH